jgi:hypothetical protein
MLLKRGLVTFDVLVEPTRAREHGGNNKRDTDKKEEDIVYEVSTQVSLVHGDRK